MKVSKIGKNEALKEVARLFLRLGLIGFGGPAVHIAMMEDEVVRKRNWMSRQHFLDLVGATNLIPGPNSTEMTMHCGRERGGLKGLVIAGCCFIFPAVLITGTIAWAYFEYGQLPSVMPFIYGIQPAIISVILVTMLRLGRQALKTLELGLTGMAAALAVLAGINEILVLFGSGFLGILLYLFRRKKYQALGIFPLPFLGVPAIKLFFIFLKIGSILYGSGYVLFAFLDAELVEKGLFTTKQLVDAIAVGQFTPGPVFSSATFIGWQLNGFGGAVAATAGIFLPSFLFVAFLNPLIPKLRSSRIMGIFLDTVNMASVAIMLSVLFEMARHTLLDWRTITLALAGLITVVFFKKLNTAFIVAGGSVLGYFLSLI